MMEFCGNVVILKSKELLSLLNFEWDLKFYFLHTKLDEVGTTLKPPKTINGNVNVKIENEDKEGVNLRIENERGGCQLLR